MYETPYQALSISPEASVSQVDHAYQVVKRGLQREMQGPVERPEIARRLQLVDAAYEVLGDPESRKDFDENPDGHAQLNWEAAWSSSFEEREPLVSEPVHRAGETWNDESDEDDLGDWNEYETNVYDDDGDSVRSSKASEWNGEFMDTAFLDARSDSSEYIEEEMRGQEEEEDDELDKQNAESWVTED